MSSIRRRQRRRLPASPRCALMALLIAGAVVFGLIPGASPTVAQMSGVQRSGAPTSEAPTSETQEAIAQKRPPNLIADLSESRIDIETDFTGARLHLFGAIVGVETDDPSSPFDTSSDAIDIVVTVKGPSMPIAVRKKEERFGLWINRDTHRFVSSPSFYAIASTRDFADIAPPSVFHAMSLFPQDLLKPEKETADTPVFAAALIRFMSERQLYQIHPGGVKVQGDRLFHAVLDVGADVSTGRYEATFHLFQNGRPVFSSVRRIAVAKSGLTWRIHDFSHRMPWLFGFLCVAAALSFGWLSAAATRLRQR